MVGVGLFVLLANAVTAGEPTEPSLKGLRERWSEAMRTLRIPGLAVVAVRGDDVVLLETLGIRNPEGKKPVTPDTQFYIASCTKTYTATVITQLAEAGKLDLDAPVKRYLPRFQLADDDATQKITVRDLLTHRPSLNTFPIVFLDAFTGDITEDRFYYFLKNVKPRTRPGYSNLHFTLLGRVIESIDNKSWRDALGDRLFTPAGMTRTTAYASKLYGDADAALPLEARGDGFVPYSIRKTDRTMHAAGGLGTTARDLGRWLRLNLNGGRIDGKQLLSEAMIKQMHTRQSDATRNHPHPDYKLEGFGLAWMVGTYKGHALISHGGGYTGTAAFMACLPEKKIGVAVLANSDGGATGLVDLAAFDVFDRLLGSNEPDLMPKLHDVAKRHEADRQREAARESKPVDEKALSLAITQYVGKFENEHWGTIRVEAKQGRLEAMMGDLPVPLKSVEADRFQVGIDSRTWRDARFEMNDGKVTAVVIKWNDYGDAVFQLKGK